MRPRLTKFTLRRMMAVVAFWALMFAFALDIYPSVGKFVKQDTQSGSQETMLTLTRSWSFS